MKRVLDEMQEYMVKIDWLDIWAKDMEGGITSVLYILYDRMRKLDIG